MTDRNYDLFIFDWDGTLANSTGMIAACVQAAAREAGLRELTFTEASYVIGLGLQEAITHLYGNDVSAAQRIQMAEGYKRHYYAQDIETPLFEGAFDALQNLEWLGFNLAVATGKGRKGLNTSLQLTGLGQFMTATRCVDECPSKPNPQMIVELLEETNTLASRALMIGDTTFDMEMAKNAGIAGLAVTYGAHSREDLTKFRPLQQFASFNELNTWLLKNG